MFFSNRDKVISQARLFKFIIVCLTICLTISSYFVYRAVSHHTVILIPSVITEKIEFIAGKPSKRYLIDIARQAINLGFNYSPATAREQFNELLTLFLPQAYAENSNVWYDIANRIEETKTSNILYIYNIEIQNEVITIKGNNVKLFNNYEVKQNHKTYIIGYKIQEGRFGLEYIKEAVK